MAMAVAAGPRRVVAHLAQVLVDHLLRGFRDQARVDVAPRVGYAVRMDISSSLLVLG